MKRFSMQHKFFKTKPEIFSEYNAPHWLTSEYTKKGSTMDSRWFWEDYVLALDVGQSVDTDFNIITRIE
jgi:hypothetical protein